MPLKVFERGVSINSPAEPCLTAYRLIGEIIFIYAPIDLDEEAVVESCSSVQGRMIANA